MNRYSLLLLFVWLLPSSALAQDGYHDTVVIVLDGSGSMAETMQSPPVAKMDAAKRALKKVVTQVEPDTHVGLLVFAGPGIYWAYEPAAVDTQALSVAIDAIVPGAATPLGASIKVAADRLMEERNKQHGMGRYRLLVVTDGEASDGPVMASHAAELTSRQIAMDVIGVNMPGGAEHTLAKFGRSYQSADDAVQLVAAIRKAIIVEAGGTSGIEVDFDETANVPLESARGWLTALSNQAPNHPLGTQPPQPEAKEGTTPQPAPPPTSSPAVPETPASSDGCSFSSGAFERSRGGAFSMLLFTLLVLGLWRRKR
jgi:uncharacterized protein YegL